MVSLKRLAAARGGLPLRTRPTLRLRPAFRQEGLLPSYRFHLPVEKSGHFMARCHGCFSPARKLRFLTLTFFARSNMGANQAPVLFFTPRLRSDLRSSFSLRGVKFGVLHAHQTKALPPSVCWSIQVIFNEVINPLKLSNIN